MSNLIMKVRIRRARRNHRRAKRFRTYREIQRVLVLFNIEHLDEAVALVKILEAEGKKVRAYSLDKRKVDYGFLPHAFHIWNKSHLSAFSVPLQEYLEEVEAYKADTLIDMTIKQAPWHSLVYFHTDADYRIGFNCQDPSRFDLLIGLGQEQPLAFFLDQLLFYLKSIRTS
ncbi:MAG: hypothetical protein GXY09_00075 [Bacteroidales bacterium]|nr:hypothetical protein [Bacteroidales bacterium]